MNRVFYAELPPMQQVCKDSHNTSVSIHAFHVYYPLRYCKAPNGYFKIEQIYRFYYLIILRKAFWWTLGGGLCV